MPRDRHPRVRTIGTKRARSNALREMQPQDGVLVCDPIDCGLDCAGDVEPGALGVRGGTTVAPSQSDSPGKLAREHFYFVVYFSAAVDVVSRLRLL